LVIRKVDSRFLEIAQEYNSGSMFVGCELGDNVLVVEDLGKYLVRIMVCVSRR
jgi:hypothetical protein